MGERKSKKSIEKKLGAGGKGLPIPKNANQIAMAAGPEGADRDNLEEIPLRDRTAVDEQFPIANEPSKDKNQVRLTQKLELQQQGMQMQKDANVANPVPGVTPMGILHATDSDFAALEKMREHELELQFEQWFASNYDKMGPEQKEYARSMFGHFYSKRLKNLEYNLSLLGRLARIKIEGIKTKQDLLLQYAAEAGFIDTDYIENILHPERAARAQVAAERQKNFRRGWLNPRRLLRGDWGGDSRIANSMKFTGREMPAPAASFGVDGEPFGVVDVDQSEEQLPNFAKTMNAVQI